MLGLSNNVRSNGRKNWRSCSNFETDPVASIERKRIQSVQSDLVAMVLLVYSVCIETNLHEPNISIASLWPVRCSHCYQSQTNAECRKIIICCRITIEKSHDYVKDTVFRSIYFF